MLPIFDRMLRREANLPLRRQRRRNRDEFNIENITDARFRELFRVNKALFGELCRLISPYLPIPQHRDKVSAETKILAAIYFYATGGYQRRIGGDFNLSVSQTSVHR